MPVGSIAVSRAFARAYRGSQDPAVAGKAAKRCNISTLLLNASERMNALNKDLGQVGLNELCRLTNGSSDRLVVIAGALRGSFCAGVAI